MKKNVSQKFGGEVISYSFDSLYEYIDYLDHGVVSPAFRSHQASIDSGSSWAGTRDYETARILCLEGEYSDEFDKFDKKRIELEKDLVDKIKRARTKADVVGYAPNVPRYLQGHPLNMFNHMPNPKKARPLVTLNYNITASSYESAENLRNRGICTLALIKDLETRGFRVNLNLIESSYCNDQTLLCKWKLKEADDPIDYRKTFFPLVNPSFLRRLYFRLEEITPELSASWNSGYGRPLEASLTREFFGIDSVNLLINTPSDHGICGKNLKDDYDSFFKSLNVEGAMKKAIENANNDSEDSSSKRVK